MLFSDTYKTIVKVSNGLYKDRGSRFIAIAIPVKSQEEIKARLDELRKEYHDARHHCYAWVLAPDRQSWRSNDDGEPSGTAGRPILAQINSRDLTNVLVVVIRYFGGTLLGVSGLINAYRSAASDALESAEIVEKKIMQVWRVTFPYIAMNDVMKVLKDEGCDQGSHNFGDDCSVDISIRSSLSDQVIERLGKISGIKTTWVRTT